MLESIDRIQIVAEDRLRAGQAWRRLLGAQHDFDDEVSCLGAARSTFRIGDGSVEFLEPSGPGAVMDAIERRGGAHLFAAGVSTRNIDELADRVGAASAAAGVDAGIQVGVEAGQVFVGPEVTGGHGLRLVVSEAADRPGVGAIDSFYEVTNLVVDVQSSLQRYVELLGLETSAFEAIESSFYGYEGTLTMFESGRLDRLEVIEPNDPTTTMGRFFSKCGESLYMAFAESGEMDLIEERSLEAGAPHTSLPSVERRGARGPDTIFLHPNALGGMMLGISRRSHAWVWSGAPERDSAANG